jgi:hypothetical protein
MVLSAKSLCMGLPEAAVVKVLKNLPIGFPIKA